MAVFDSLVLEEILENIVLNGLNFIELTDLRCLSSHVSQAVPQEQPANIAKVVPFAGL